MPIHTTVEIFPEIPLYLCGPAASSIDVAWRLVAEQRLPIWGSLLVESQTAGRGRMGRVWQSPPGHVYAALRLPLAPPFDGPGASLALAYLLLLALEDFGWEFQLKWPNDLIFQGGKVCGILLESRGGDLIAGVGFNLVAVPEGEWQKGRDPGAPRPVALPFAKGAEVLWAALVKRLILLYNKKFGGVSMPELVKAAEKFLLWRGKNVRVSTPASEPPAPSGDLRARVVGLGAAGELLLENSQNSYNLWSGTVCLDEKGDLGKI